MKMGEEITMSYISCVYCLGFGYVANQFGLTAKGDPMLEEALCEMCCGSGIFIN